MVRGSLSFRSARGLPSLRRRPPGVEALPPSPPSAGGPSPLLAYEVAELRARRRRRALSFRAWVLLAAILAMPLVWWGLAASVESYLRSLP